MGKIADTIKKAPAGEKGDELILQVILTTNTKERDEIANQFKQKYN